MSKAPRRAPGLAGNRGAQRCSKFESPFGRRIFSAELGSQVEILVQGWQRPWPGRGQKNIPWRPNPGAQSPENA